MRRSIVPALTAFAVLGACQQPAAAPEPEAPAPADTSTAPEEEPSPVPVTVPLEATAPLAQGNNLFAWSLYDTLDGEPGNIFVSHAGASPDRPLAAQQPDTLLWGDDRFLEVGGPQDCVVVHGHWAGDIVDWGRNRVCIDTGAYLSQRLTALRIDPATDYRTIST